MALAENSVSEDILAPWPSLPQPVAALGQPALRHLAAHLAGLAAEAPDEAAEDALLHEADAAERALAAWRPLPPLDLPEASGGAPARLPLPNGGWALRPAAGGLVLYDATGAPYRTLEGLEAVAQLARLGWQTPGLRAAFEEVSRGQISVEEAIRGYERVPVATLFAGPGRRLQIDQLAGPTGWPRALLLWEPGAAPDAPPPLLLEGPDAVDQLSRAQAAPRTEAAAEAVRLYADLHWGILHNSLPDVIPSADDAAAYFRPGPGRPTTAALGALLQALVGPEAGLPPRPPGARLELELRVTGHLAEGRNDGLFAEAWSALDPDLEPGQWVAAWAWADEQGALRVRYEGLFHTDRGWRWLPKPWRASPRGR